MGMSVEKYLERQCTDLDPAIKNELMRLNGNCILSPRKHKNRVNCEHLHHLKYPSTKQLSNGDIVSCEKEYAYAHFICLDNKIYFSKNATCNGNVMENNETVDKIYNDLSSVEIKNIDREAKEITLDNVHFIVDTLLDSIPPVKKIK